MNALLACDWQRFVNYDLPVLLWGIIILGSLLIILKMLKPVIKEYLKLRYETVPKSKYEHELNLKEEAFGREMKWHELQKQEKNDNLSLKIREYNELTKIVNDDELARKIREYNELTKIVNDDELARKIREYNELTIHQKLLEKATGIDKDIEDLKKTLDDMKKKYESLDGEIEQIIIKKK